MKSSMKICSFLALSLSLALASAPASAQATRTWVSGVGDDANPCSRISPCKTFAGAISKTVAGGEIDALDPGGFGAITITKAITIDGGGQVASVLVAGTNAINVAAGVSDVVHLRNLSLQGLGGSNAGLNAIQFTSGAALHVENLRIFGFAKNGVDFEPTNNALLMISNSIITDNAGGGVLIKPATGAFAAATLLNLTSSHNSFGLGVQDGTVATVQNSAMNDNATFGASAFSASVSSEINIERSVVSRNAQDGVTTKGAGSFILISQVGIFSNGTGVFANGGNILSYGNNQINGNGVDGAPTSTVPNK